MRQVPLPLIVGKLSPLWRDDTGEISGSRAAGRSPSCQCMHGKGFADTVMLGVIRKTQRGPLPFLASIKH